MANPEGKNVVDLQNIGFKWFFDNSGRIIAIDRKIIRIPRSGYLQLQSIIMYFFYTPLLLVFYFIHSTPFGWPRYFQTFRFQPESV